MTFLYVPLLPLVTCRYHLSSTTEREIPGKVQQEAVLQACCGVCDDAFQLASGVSFYSGTSELISVSMRLEDVLQGALERFLCSANKDVIWFAEVCGQNPNQITTVRLNM